MENQTELLEIRATTDGAKLGQLVNTVKMSDQIIRMTERKTNVLSRVPMFSTLGNTSFPVSVYNPGAKLTPEMENIQESELSTANVDISQRRYGHTVVVSKANIHDSAMALNSYIPAELTAGLGETLQDAMFSGGTTEITNDGKGIQNILMYNSHVKKIENIETINDAAEQMNHDHLWEAYLSLAEEPGMLDGAIVVVHNVKKLAAIKDATGLSILKPENKPEGSIGTVFGLPVVNITNPFTAIGPDVAGQATYAGAIFMNPAKSYLITLGNGQSNTIAAEGKNADGIMLINGDTKQSLRGTNLYLAQVYAGGQVVNPRGIKIVRTPIDAENLTANDSEQVENPMNAKATVAKVDTKKTKAKAKPIKVV